MKPMFLLLALLLSGSPEPQDDWSDFVKLSRDKSEGKRCQAIDAIKKYKDLKMVRVLLPLLADPHERVRYRTMRAIGACKDAQVTEFLVSKGLRQGHPLIRGGVAESLGWIKDKTVTAQILKALDRAKKEYKAALCSALGWIRDEESLEALLEAFDDRDWRVRVRALEAVQKIDPSRAGDIVAKAAKAKEYQVRMKAAEYWPAIDKTAASLGLGDLAKDKDWRVRFAVIQATEELRTRECIGWLVSLLGSEQGRLRWDVLMALHSLTGKDLGLNSKNWESWWQFNKDTFEVVPKKTATGGPTVKDTTSTFFEVPILSTRVLFILDLSGSMKDMSPLKDEKGKTMRKLEVAKQGMMATIQSLSPKTKFSIIGLGAADDGSYLLQSQKTWKKKLRLFPANPGSKRDAIKWVRSLEAKGYTNIYDAILYGMQDPEVDSIYLYTDGGASRGIFIKTSEILNFVQRNNEFRKVTLHTIEVPGTSNTKDNIRLLQSLAEESGGTYQLYEKKK